MSRITEKHILDLIGTLYDQAQEPSRDGWQDVYLQIADLFSSGPGGLLLRNEEYDRFNLVAGTSSLDAIREYVDHYQFISPFRDTLKDLTVGDGFHRAGFMPDKAFIRTEFYNDFLQDLDIFNYVYFPLVKVGGTTAAITISRPRSMPNFTKAEEKAIAVLLPHIKRSLEVYVSFADVQSENQTILAALATMPQGVIVVDKERKIKFCNQTAESIINLKDGLKRGADGTLRAGSAGDDKKLSEVLKGIFNPSIANLGNHGGALQLSRTIGYRPLQVLVSPFAAHSFMSLDTEPLAMIFVNDPDQHIETNESALVQMYSLTNAEAHFAAVLADGKSLNEACEILGITPNTARTHLKRIFSKTDTNRQSELVKLIVNGPANLKVE